jgi:secondary thiamine-phosphate synthase enzyme
MNIYSEHLTFHSKQKREIVNITEPVKAALHKSGFHDGIILVATLHSNSAILVNDDEPGFLEDLTAWLERLCPADAEYKHKGRFESTSDVHLQAILLNQNATVGVSDGKLDLGPWQFIHYVELDGMRPKRVLIKILGE